MDIFMKGVGRQVTEIDLTLHIADILHNPDYGYKQFERGGLINFRVSLFRDKRYRLFPHSGSGILSLPHQQIAEKFLAEFRRLSIGSMVIDLSPSNKPPRPDVTESLRRMPYVNPLTTLEHQKRLTSLSHDVRFRKLQFGWDCRDKVFSIEWERERPYPLSADLLKFDDQRREIKLHLGLSGHPTLSDHLVSFRYSNIHDIGVSKNAKPPSLMFWLKFPPLFGGTKRIRAEGEPVITQVYCLDDDHRNVVPFTSMVLRVELEDDTDLKSFLNMCEIIQKRTINYTPYLERRGLFRAEKIAILSSWLSEMRRTVALQCESIYRDLLLDTDELLMLRKRIERLVSTHKEIAVDILKHFAVQLANWDWRYGEENSETETVAQLFDDVVHNYKISKHLVHERVTGVFDCYHLKITPTAIQVQGPFPERSNRVIRSYPGAESFFVRVTFTSEDGYNYRFDKDVDGPAFIRERMGTLLRTGINVGGRTFQFLAYSMSALKEHSVWAMEPFRLKQNGVATVITPEGIRNDLGDFTKVIHYPALYAARISQGFTATDPGVKVNAEELFPIDDIERNGHTFTDGVGTMSTQLAEEVWKAQLSARRRRVPSGIQAPSAWQIRFAGSKGMVSVDHRLKGRILCLRPSMIKFESPSLDIEIAKTFTKPSRMNLNRPMIMLLEGLGVDASVFMHLQEKAVQETYAATSKLLSAVKLLEAYGLGGAFRLPSIWTSLQKRGFDFSGVSTTFLLEEDFESRVLNYIVNHVLRELKHHARIPVPGSWTLVGVADIYDYLREGEIFACIRKSAQEPPIFLEGLCLVTRSPVIHPGDIQQVYAVGKPPPGSAYAKQPLANTIVFSVKGERPLPNCLGGGDLDGDEFNVITMPELFPTRLYEAATYPPTQRKKLDRPSTVDDIIDFIVEYISSDLVGIIAITWLILADQSQHHILDPDCLKLAQLHSDAVDYPKSGIPVNIKNIPRQLFLEKPDWAAPETVANTDGFYESQRAIGKLFRDIELPSLADVMSHAQEQRRQIRRGTRYSIDKALKALSLDAAFDAGPLSVALRNEVDEFIDLDAEDDLEEARKSVYGLFEAYVTKLLAICQDHALNTSRRFNMLTEEEVVVGTILAKSNNKRYRREIMSKMRERSTALVTQVREELSGEKNTPALEWLRRSWVAWMVSIQNTTEDEPLFGARSFGYIALGSLFDAIDTIQNTFR